MINDSCFSKRVHLFPPVQLKLLLRSTWGSYRSRFIVLMHFIKPLENICSQMRAHVSLHAQRFAILCVPDWAEETLWWCESPCLDLFDPPPGVHQAAELLTMHQGSCRSPFSALGETTEQERSVSGSDSLLGHEFPKAPSAKHMEGREAQGLFSNPAHES